MGGRVGNGMGGVVRSAGSELIPQSGLGAGEHSSRQANPAPNKGRRPPRYLQGFTNSIKPRSLIRRLPQAQSPLAASAKPTKTQRKPPPGPSRTLHCIHI